jgi:hypothetical protein
MLQTHLETLRTDSPIGSVTLTAEPTAARQKQFSLFEAALRDPHQFQETLARLSALVGADRVGTPVRENSHRSDAFTLAPPDFENAPAMIGQRVAEILRATPVRRLRPAVKAVVEVDEPAMRQPDEGARQADSVSTLQRFNASSPPVRKDNIIELLGPLFNGSAGESDLNPDLAFNPDPDSLGGTAIRSKIKIRITSTNERESSRPVAIRCKVAKGRLTIAVGPWRASGRWWEPGAWQRDEWDVQTRDGQALRLVQTEGEWRVEAVVD